MKLTLVTFKPTNINYYISTCPKPILGKLNHGKLIFFPPILHCHTISLFFLASIYSEIWPSAQYKR